MDEKQKMRLMNFGVVVIAVAVYFSFNNNKSEEITENTQTENTQTETTQTENQTTENTNVKTISYKDAEGNIVEFESVDHVVTPLEYGEYNFEYALLSEIPEEDIYLYEHNGGGWILVQGEEGEYISKATNIIPPRFNLPQMFYEDFDNDNEKEILINFYVGSGTGISYEELGMIEKSTSDEKVFEEMLYFDNATYSDILNDNTEYEISDKGDVTLKFTPKGGTNDLEIYYLGIVDGARDLEYQSNVYFTVEDNKILGSHEVGIFQHDYASPTYGIGAIKTNVVYNGSEFALDKFEFVFNEEATK